MLRSTLALVLGVLLIVAEHVWAQSAPLPVKPPKKEKELDTQTLPLTPEPPPAVTAEAARLAFHVSPLSAKGLLTQQVRDALKALDRANGGAIFVKLRAFVAGTGDMRRVATIVAEELSAKKVPLPAVTTIQVGALPLAGAQVVIESISYQKSDKKPLNPNGLAFFSAKPVPELAAAAKAQNVVMMQLTCFLGDLAQMDNARAAIASAFPGVTANFVQPTRLGVEPGISCEGAGRLGTPGKSPTKLVFTGIQMSFQDRDQDLRLAYGRLGRALETMKAAYSGTLALNVYSPNPSAAKRAAALAADFVGPAALSQASTLIVEGLPSPDATVAIELIAAAP